MSAAATRAPTAEWVTACFHILDDGTRKCKLCPQKYKKETGTSNLRTHMWESNGRHSNLAEQSVVPKGKVTREREDREKQRKERRQQLSQQQEGSEEKDEPAALVEEQRAEEQVIGPVVSRKRKARQERSDAAPDEREERMRMSKQRRSAQSTPKSLEEVISEWIEEHGDAWSPQLRTVLEGSLHAWRPHHHRRGGGDAQAASERGARSFRSGLSAPALYTEAFGSQPTFLQA